MADREKVIHEFGQWCDAMADECPVICIHANDLLKEQEEREKRICKGICDFIRGSCSTDTDSDKEYVCHVVQQMFIKGRGVNWDA